MGHFYLDSTVEDFCELLEDFCGRAEIPSDDQDEAEWLPVAVSDLRMLVNEIMSICSKKVLHLVPVEILSRLLRVLDHQVHRAEGLSIDECEHVSVSFISWFFIYKACVICDIFVVPVLLFAFS